jgi:hypothetical protein
MNTNCPLLLADLFSYSYEAEYVQKLLYKKNKPFAMAFNSTFRYTEDVLLIHNDQFHSFVDSIYQSELEIKSTTEASAFASYLDILLNIDVGGKLTPQSYDTRDEFHFAMVNFLYACSNIQLSHAYDVYISQLIRYVRARYTY